MSIANVKKLEGIYQPSSLNNLEPLLSFSVISDTHCGDDISLPNNINLRNALADLNEVCPNADALCIVGDMTDFGKDAEYDVFMDTLNSVPHPMHYLVMGNHDVRWQDKGYKEAYDRFVAKTNMPGAYYDQWIKGYHFIFMSSDDDLKDEAYISQQQLDWISTTISKDVCQGKPIFVFLHQSLKNTSAGSYPENGYGTSGYPDGVVGDSQLRDILKRYPQCVFISGHTHAVVESPKMVDNTSGIVCINTSSVSYTISVDGVGLDKESQGVCIEVYPDYIIIRGRNFTNKHWVVDAQWQIEYPQI